MPITPIHGLLSFSLAGFFTKNRNLLLLAFIAGMLPDLDGIGLLFNLSMFYAFHHELLHAPVYGLVFAVPAGLVMRKIFKESFAKSALVFAASFISHPLIDIFFTAWPVKLLWPFSSEQFSCPVLVDYNWLLAGVVFLAASAQILRFFGGQPRKIA